MSCAIVTIIVVLRESIYRLLPQTTPENVSKNFSQYTLDPTTRYPNISLHLLRPNQVRRLTRRLHVWFSKKHTSLSNWEWSLIFCSPSCKGTASDRHRGDQGTPHRHGERGQLFDSQTHTEWWDIFILILCAFEFTGQSWVWFLQLNTLLFLS